MYDLLIFSSYPTLKPRDYQSVFVLGCPMLTVAVATKIISIFMKVIAKNV